MKKIVTILFIFIALSSCKKEADAADYIATWTAVKKQNSTYVIVDCGTDGVTIKAAAGSLFFRDVMEDNDYKIDHTKQQGSSTVLFLDNDEESWFKFTWADKIKGIAQWDIKYDGSPLVTKYFVNNKGVKKIQHVKGGSDDCITNEELGDVVNDSLAVDSGKLLLNVDDDNCITVKNSGGGMLFGDCFEVDFVNIRHKKGNYLPLTFISGKKAIDADFYNTDDKWTATRVTYFDPAVANGKGKTATIQVNLNEVDFEAIAEKVLSAD